MKKILLFLLIVVGFISCKKAKVAPAPVKKTFNVLILGNSITFSPTNIAGGWSGNWGMAASVADSDYVHRLTVNFERQDSTSKVTAVNIAAFETDFSGYDLDGMLSTYRNLHPDLLLLRIGENVPNGFDTTAFDTKYSALINYFKTGNSNLHIFAAGSFFEGKDAVDAQMKKYSPFISLSYLAPDATNESWGLFSNYSVESHPSDKGMRAIADTIWKQVRPLVPSN